MSVLSEWDHGKGSCTPALAHNRAGVDAEPTDLNQTGGSQLIIADETFKTILNLLKRMNAEPDKIKETGNYSKVEVSFVEKPHATPLGVFSSYRFLLKTYVLRERQGFDSEVTDLFLQYSLVPEVYTSGRGPNAQKKVRWYLNVGCNPAFLAGMDDLSQVAGMPRDFPYLGKHRTDGRQALILFHTLGYWWLEVGPADLLGDATLKFRWEGSHKDSIMEGEVILNEVAFSFLGDRVTARDINQFNMKMEIAYNDRHKFRSGKKVRFTRAESVGRYLNLAFDRPTYEHAKRGKKGEESSEESRYDLRPVVLTSRSGANVKVRLRLDNKLFYGTTKVDGKSVGTRFRRHQQTLSFTSRYFLDKRTATVIYKPFTLSDFVDLCESCEQFPAGTSHFEMQYAYAIKLHSDAMRNNFMFTQLVSLDPRKLIETLDKWIGDSEERYAFFTAWSSHIPDERESDKDAAKRMGMPIDRLRKYRHELKKLGVDLRLPLPLYVLLVDAMLAADETIEEKLNRRRERKALLSILDTALTDGQSVNMVKLRKLTGELSDLSDVSLKLMTRPRKLAVPR